MNKWIVIREGWPLKRGQVIALYLAVWDAERRVWYNAQSGGTYDGVEIQKAEVWENPQLPETPVQEREGGVWFPSEYEHKEP